MRPGAEFSERKLCVDVGSVVEICFVFICYLPLGKVVADRPFGPSWSIDTGGGSGELSGR